MDRSTVLSLPHTIEARGLGKRFDLKGRGRRSGAFWAVRDVSFSIAPGQVVGVIGRNGSGKTTLLKMLSRVTQPTEGTAEISGRITAMLGVGTGMHPMFTGRENIFFGGMVLGLDRDFIDSRIDSIVDFAGIGSFIDRPIKIYSSGMRARLGFAIAAQMEPEILFLDEVLAVGDHGFQQKCLHRIREMRMSGSTILLVTHNINVVKSFCDSAILLDKGKLVMQGKPEDVVGHYLTEIIGEPTGPSTGEATREGNGALQVEDFWFEDTFGRKLDAVSSGEAVTLCLGYRCPSSDGADNVSVGVAFADSYGRWLFRVDNDISGHPIGSVPQNGALRCSFPRFPLTKGRYKFGYRITCGGEVADYVVEFGGFDVEPGDFFGTGEEDAHSPVLIDHNWQYQPDAKVPA
jgi:lipopolysaccharide transport system ATP-binding protein